MNLCWTLIAAISHWQWALHGCSSSLCRGTEVGSVSKSSCIWCKRKYFHSYDLTPSSMALIAGACMQLFAQIFKCSLSKAWNTEQSHRRLIRTMSKNTKAASCVPSFWLCFSNYHFHLVQGLKKKKRRGGKHDARRLSPTNSITQGYF